ncbi:PDZ domain-containing protein 11 isoform 1-T1 [Leptosomus discolor]
MEGRVAYDDFPVVFLPPYESPPAWVPPHERVYHPDYNNELTQFLPRTIVLKKPPGAQLGFNIRGGKASQLGIFISKVCLSFCYSLTVFCLFVWVLLSQLGVQGDCHMHLQTHSCNLPHTKQQSDGPAPFPDPSPGHRVLLVHCSPCFPSSLSHVSTLDGQCGELWGWAALAVWEGSCGTERAKSHCCCLCFPLHR